MTQLQAQSVHLTFTDVQLNQVFLELRDSFDVQFSFNDALLSNCKVSVDQDYSSLEVAIAELVGKCGLDVRKRGNVYLVVSRENKGSSGTFVLHGSVVNQQTKLPLPFSTVKVDRSGVVTDGNGRFTFATTNSIVPVQVSHVGYYKADTVLLCSGVQQIELSPQSVDLSEVVVTADKERAVPSPIIETPGKLKLNRQMSSFLPGSSDNTINNLLRLQSGVLAAGEQTNEFTIWGSYKGQSHVIYDGITLFNFSTISDNIGVVNPLMISDIEVMKAGYNVHIGDRAGGVVNITSTEGRKDGIHGDVRISDQSTAARLNIPLTKKVSLQAAGRFVFPQNLGNVIHEGLKGTPGKRMFADGNFKISGSFSDHDNFKVSLIGGREQDFQQGSDPSESTGSIASRDMDNYQVGVSGAYSRAWKRAGTSRANFSYSTYSSSLSNLFAEAGTGTPDSLKTGLEFAKNGISEIRAQVEHELPSTKVQTASVSVGFVHNQSAIAFDSTTVSLPRATKNVSRTFVFIKDDIRIGSLLTLQPGVRLDVRLENTRVFFQPRFGILLRPNEAWRIRLAWGLYNQFIAENALVGPFGNELYFWQVADGTGNFVQRSMHNMVGVSFSKWGFNAAVEGYYKTLNGLVRWTYDTASQNPFFHANGEGRSYGFDATLKKKFWKLDLSAAYSWSRTEDAFNSIENGTFQRAPHDQRHEVKAAAILDLRPFFISLNFVHGSGFSIQGANGMNEDIPYNRLDAAFLFQKKVKKVTLETGLSVLNVTNSQNIRYTSFTSFPDASRIYRSGIRITPLVFFNVRF